MTPLSNLSSRSLGKIATSLIPFKISISFTINFDLVRIWIGNLYRLIIPSISRVKFNSFSTAG
jgi:hypothetical protein